jgi:hypothetical protein
MGLRSFMRGFFVLDVAQGIATLILAMLAFAFLAAVHLDVIDLSRATPALTAPQVPRARTIIEWTQEEMEAMADLAPAASTGRSSPLAIVVSNAANVQLTPTPGGLQTHARGDCVVAAGSPDVFVVSETATDTSMGFGPFAAGSTFAVPTLAWARTAAAPGGVRCQFVQDAAVGQGGGGLSGGTADGLYMRLDATNAPTTSTWSSSTAATLAAPSWEGVGSGDFCIANAAGSRGICIDGDPASSFDNGVTFTGTAAAASGRAAFHMTSSVTGVSDRFIARHTSTGGGGGVGVFSVAGNGGLVNESALNGGQLYVADAAGMRSAAGIVTSENAAAGHTLDTTTTLGGATNLLAINNNGTFSAAVDASGTFISEAGNGCGDLSFEVATGSATGMSTNGLHTDLDFCVGGVASMEVSGSRIALGVDVTSGVNVTGANPVVSSNAVGTSARLRAWNAATTSLHDASTTIGIAGLPGAG